jgi:FMN reductase
MSASTARSLVVVTAGLGQPSSTRLLADRLSVATDRHLRDAGVEPVIELIELRDHAQDLVNHLLTGFPSPRLQTAIDAVLACDGLIALSPIFNASYSGLFKLFFDVIQRDAFAGKPVLIAATGGTARHSLALEHALRPLFAYLRAVVAPTAVFAASEDWAGGDGTSRALAERMERAAGELAGLVSGRPAAAAADAFESPTPFEQLLRAP